MRLEYSRHARVRLRERDFTEQDVIYCIEQHHSRYTDGRGNRRYVARLADGRLIQVVVDERRDPWVVVTVID